MTRAKKSGKSSTIESLFGQENKIPFAPSVKSKWRKEEGGAGIFVIVILL